MKQINFISIFATLWLLMGLGACNKSTTSTFSLIGDVDGGNASYIYLYDVYDEQYNYVELVDSTPIIDNHFELINDSLKAKLYFLTTKGSPLSMETLAKGQYVFLSGGKNSVNMTLENDNRIASISSEDALFNNYVQYMKERSIAGNEAQIDSINTLFYAARDRHDRAEMARLKAADPELYEEAEVNKKALLEQKLKEYSNTLFGLYLYYTYQFQHITFQTNDEIDVEYNKLSQYDVAAKNSGYYDLMKKKLEIARLSAVGSIAPEIEGMNINGDRVLLSDFRGQYVLVDFWSSGCSWCRLETPFMKDAYNTYKDKGFTILGVSTDYKRDEWIKAIEEDGADWSHILLPEDKRNEILKQYSVVGIPVILLIDPEGKILAKELRGDAIKETIALHVPQL